MIKELSSPEVQAFLREHVQTNPARVALMKNLPAGVSPSLLASQLKARQKAKDKLPSWYSRDGIIFPHGVAMEQCSSEATALWKAKSLHGARFLDLTGGTGVDSWAFSKTFTEGVFVEADEERCRFASNNLKALRATNVHVINASAEDFLGDLPNSYDLVYLDPDRRAANNRAVGFKDCVPDAALLLPVLLKRSPLVLIKASPMLDINKGIKDLESVSEVAIVAVNNEVKEVLFFCGKENKEGIIKAVNLSSGGEDVFQFSFPEEDMSPVDFSAPLAYLYEPYSSILKAGAFKTVAARYGLKKLHKNTHLYTSENLVSHFPGRIFKVLEVKDFSSRVLKSGLFPFKRAHAIARNFPLRADELQRKLKIDEGEDAFIIATTTLPDRKILIAGERLK